MIYLTGTHALNLTCSLETCGDWHTSALAWKELHLSDTDNSIYGSWGIESEIKAPNGKMYKHADHLRAILDIMEDDKWFMLRQMKGFKEDFICTDIYDDIFMSKVFMLKYKSNWEEINKLMKMEYKCKWLKYLEEHK